MADKLRSSALAACRLALWPLVRMLLRHGVMHKDFVELSKEIYVDVARREYGIRGRPTNVSRVVLLTGLGRKEVTRLRDQLEQAKAKSAPAAATGGRHDRISRVLSGWHQHPDYLDDMGKPLVLEMGGAAPSFASLVKQYGGDVPAVTILRELKRSGAVLETRDKRVAPVRRNYRLDTAEPESVQRAGSVLADIGRTVTHNLYRDAKDKSRFEARATNTNIPTAAMPAWRKFIYREGQQFLERVDDWLTNHEVSDAEAKKKPAQRVGLGMYWIQDEPRRGGS